MSSASTKVTAGNPALDAGSRPFNEKANLSRRHVRRLFLFVA